MDDQGEAGPEAGRPDAPDEGPPDSPRTRGMWAALVSLKGRRRRGAFWIVAFSLSALLYAGLFVVEHFSNGAGIRDMPGLWGAFTLYYVLLIWVTFANQVQRVHDIGWTGWIALMMFVPWINILFLLIIGIIPGTRGPNRYG